MASDSGKDEPVERFTRDQAVQIALAEAKRGYSEQHDRISYIAYTPEVLAFCLCEFVSHEGAWIKTFRLLTPSEWLPGEEIRDETILDAAGSGDRVSAVRLYRSKHGVGLQEAPVAIQRLLWKVARCRLTHGSVSGGSGGAVRDSERTRDAVHPDPSESC
ncbi:MAG TPA: hypothetical protein VLK65_27730 [Vicinamibacteria bacterium]|nr:hypothetical protein [Vicinamibacteria bacterium]